MDTNSQKSNFNQSFWLGISQLLAFALSFVSAAILSRYFDKVQYGTYKQILFIYTTLLTLFTAGLPSVFSYFIPRLSKGEQKELIDVLNRIFIVLGLFFSISLFFLSDWLANILENPELAIGVKVFSIFPLFTLPAMGVEGIYTAIRNTKQIAIYSLITKLISLIFIISPVIIFKTNYLGAIIGWGIANFLIFLLAMYMKRKPYIGIKKELVPNMLKSILDYSLPLVGAFIAGFCINAADQFFISRYYGTAAFADFSNGNLNIPIAIMIASSVKSVLLPVISKAEHDNKLQEIIPVYQRAVSKSAKLIFPVVIFAIFFSSYIMTFLYGIKYITSTPFLQMHALRDIIGAIPYMSLLLAFGYSKFYMKIHILGVGFVWGMDSLIVYCFHLEPYYITFIQSLLQYIIVFASFIFIKMKTQIGFIDKNIIMECIRIILHSTILSYICYLILHLIFSPEQSSVISLLSLIIATSIFFPLLIFTGRYFKIDYSEFLQLFKKLKH